MSAAAASPTGSIQRSSNSTSDVVQPTRRRNILLIEDDPGLQQYVRTVFDREQYSLTICGTGAEGLSKLQHIRPDLVLLDLFLHESDGMEILRQIKTFGTCMKH